MSHDMGCFLGSCVLGVHPNLSNRREMTPEVHTDPPAWMRADTQRGWFAGFQGHCSGVQRPSWPSGSGGSGSWGALRSVALDRQAWWQWQHRQREEERKEGEEREKGEEEEAREGLRQQQQQYVALSLRD